MENELKNLNNLSQRLKTINIKIKLLNLIEQAKSEYDKYNYTSSNILLEEANALNSNNPTILRGLGCIKQFNKNYEEAIKYYTQALKYSKNKELEYALIGTTYYMQDNLDEAIKYFNLSIEENDNYDEAYEGRNQAMLEEHVKILDLQESLKKYF